MKKGNAIMMIIFVLILASGISMTYFLIKAEKNMVQAKCLEFKSEVMITFLSNIKELRDKEMLCNNGNCTAYFQSQIEIYIDALKQTYDFNCEEIH